jgi:predicted RNA-binding Zn-ribbon protein involved in translation (DUF1610 family)
MATLIPIIMKIISIVFLIIFILSVALLVFTFRKPKKVTLLSLMLPVLISLITFTVYSFFIHYRPSILLLIGMGFAGLSIGIIWSQSTLVYAETGKVMSRNSIWYLVVWGGVFALTQLISIVTKKPPSIVMALLIMSTGSVIGMNGQMMRKYFSVKSSLGESKASLQSCPGCGAKIESKNAFCRKCGNKL